MILRHCLCCAVVWLAAVGCGHQEPPAPPAKPESEIWLDPQASRVGDVTGGTVPRAAVQDEDWFEDVTERTGIDAVFRTGREAERFTILETVGGGVCVFDVDGDGDQDLFCPGGGQFDRETGAAVGLPPRLYRNDGAWKFTDITAPSGLAAATDYSHGAVAADYDRDGDQDLFVICFGQSRLLRNDDGAFVDVTTDAGLNGRSWDTAAVFVDLTGDGWPDLYVATYVKFDPLNSKPCGRSPDRPDVCPPQDFSPLPDRLYVNLKNGQFEDRSADAGVTALGRGLGVLAADFNQDGWLDLYVANDGDPNNLYWGRPEFPLVEGAFSAGVAVNAQGAAEGSMGLDAGDFDGDGLSDIVVTNFELEDTALYRNLGNGQFEHATTQFGLAGVSRAYVGFGTGLHDFDGDNWPDLYVLKGHVLYRTGQSPFLQPSFFFHNNAGRRFVDVSDKASGYFRQRHAARGSAVVDLDNDGALDLVISGLDERITVLRNRRPSAPWIAVTLQPQQGDPAGAGADVSLEAFGRRVLIPLRVGASFASHVTPQAMFRLEPGRKTADVTIRWLSGRREVFRNRSVSQRHHLREGMGDGEL